MKKIIILFTVFFLFDNVKAQIDAGPDTAVCFGTALLNATYEDIRQTTDYILDPILYNPFSFNAGTSVTMTDDATAGPFPIGFTFCFYGNTYTQFYLGSNGWISFSPGQPTTYTTFAIPNTDPSVPKNCIMGPWEDWHPGIPGGPYIFYTTTGTAPFRRLIVSWSSCPMFDCTSLLGTFQIVIYETTNVIENYLQTKPFCNTWFTGTQGVHDASGTQAIVNPGRNQSLWTAANEGWRYTPNGADDYTINWYEAGVLIGNGPTIPVTPNTTTLYHAEIIYGCNNATFIDSVTVYFVDSVPVFVSSDVIMCIGNTTTLNAFSNGPSPGYTWSPASTLNNPVIASPEANPTVSTTYTVTVLDAAGCTGSNTVRVDITLNAPANAGNDISICTGNSSTFNATGGITYQWSPPAGLSDPDIANPVASPTANTTYTVYVVDAVGCTGTDNIVVSVNNLPPAYAGQDVTLCEGMSATFVATGGVSFSWSPTTNLSNPAVFNPVANPTVSVTYVVTVTDGNGCSAVDDIFVDVFSIPVVSAGFDATICQGTQTTLNASGGVSYSWSPTASLSDPFIFNPVASPVFTTIYTVMVTDANGCTNTDNVLINVLFAPIANAGVDKSICQGKSTGLNATGGIQFLWSPAAGLSNVTIANPTANPSITTTYTVQVTDAQGCTATDNMILMVRGLPMMDTVMTVAQKCGNEDGIVLAGLVTGGTGPYMYSLDSITFDTTKVFTGLRQGTYRVYIKDAFGCSSFKTGYVNEIISVIADFAANPVTGYRPLSVDFTNNSTGANNFIWDFGDGNTSILPAPNNIFITGGTFTISLIAYNNRPECADTATLTMVVKERVDIIHPNVFTPNDDDVNDQFEIKIKGLQNYAILIFDRWGKKVAELDNNKALWDGKDKGKKVSDGTYYFLISGADLDGITYTSRGFFQIIGSK